MAASNLVDDGGNNVRAVKGAPLWIVQAIEPDKLSVDINKTRRARMMDGMAQWLRIEASNHCMVETACQHIFFMTFNS